MIEKVINIDFDFIYTDTCGEYGCGTFDKYFSGSNSNSRSNFDICAKDYCWYFNNDNFAALDVEYVCFKSK